jgi:hypothetical protein
MTAGERFDGLRRWLMSADDAAREGVEAFRRRKYLHVPGAANKVGSLLAKVLPQRVVGRQLAATYRRSLDSAAKR